MALTPRVFADRAAAGAALAREIQQRRLAPPVLVLALPRGGVPVASEVAAALDAPLDVMLVQSRHARPAGARHRCRRLGGHRGA